MSEAWRRRVWIIDGHNMIFALPLLCALQREGDRTGARQRLEGLLASFATTLQHPLVVVYDGNALPRNPDAVDSPHLRTEFSQPPEEADDRILFLTQQALARGRAVTVVTNDRRSLAARLPSAVRVTGVEEFHERHLRPQGSAEEREAPPGDFSDIERHFLERQEEIAQKARRTGRQLERQGARAWSARFAERHRAVRGASRSAEGESGQPDEGDEVEHWEPEPLAPASPVRRAARRTAGVTDGTARDHTRGADHGSRGIQEGEADEEARRREVRKERGRRKQARRLAQQRQQKRRGRRGRR